MLEKASLKLRGKDLPVAAPSPVCMLVLFPLAFDIQCTWSAEMISHSLDIYVDTTIRTFYFRQIACILQHNFSLSAIRSEVESRDWLRKSGNPAVSKANPSNNAS